MEKKYDYLIVGSGLFGCVAAYLANQSGKKCLVIERRKHVGGNVYCESTCGINVHKYGAHIFHTSNKEVWDFVNKFVEFNGYINSPIANYEGEIYNLPFNMNTFNKLWGVTTPWEAKCKVGKECDNVKRELGDSGPSNLEEQAKSMVGEELYEKLIKGYTEKQWGRKCSELPSFIIKRIPLRYTYDNNYFNDKYQGIPIGGYNKLISGLLNGIEVITDADFFKNRAYYENVANKIIYTGPIDEYYDYKFGHLEYRTVTFKTSTHDCPNYQGNAVVNYTSSNVPYTRIIEHKHFESFGDDVYKNDKTVVSEEYPKEWEVGDEPYYPINDERNNELYKKYKELADNEDNVIFGGRLAEYKYYDMDDVIAEALKLQL